MKRLKGIDKVIIFKLHQGPSRGRIMKKKVRYDNLNKTQFEDNEMGLMIDSYGKGNIKIKMKDDFHFYVRI